jgi:hypothetical protein
MVSPFYNISAFQLSAKKDFSNEERKIEFELDRLNTALKNVSTNYQNIITYFPKTDLTFGWSFWSLKLLLL